MGPARRAVNSKARNNCTERERRSRRETPFRRSHARHCLSSIPENVECMRELAGWRDTMDWMISKALCGLCGASRHVHRVGSTFVVCLVQLTAVPQKHIGVTENQRLRIAGLQTRTAFAHPSRCAAGQPFQCGTARWHCQCSTSHAGQARQERVIAAPELERTCVEVLLGRQLLPCSAQHPQPFRSGRQPFAEKQHWRTPLL